MNIHTSRRVLQISVGILALVPLSASLAGILYGPTAFTAPGLPFPTDLDSHFRYLSGIFLAVGFGFLSCIPRIETKGAHFRLLTLLVVTGGLARLLSLLLTGAPSPPHLAGLGLELIVVPLLALWQRRISGP